MTSTLNHIILIMALSIGLVSISGCSGGEANYSLEEVQGNAITFTSRSSIIIDKQTLTILQLEVVSRNSVVFSIVEGDAIFSIDETSNNIVFADNVTDQNITESQYTVIVKAQDSFARAANQVISIEVVDDINEVKPQIDSGYNIKPFIVQGDETAVTEIVAYNPRGNEVRYTLEGTDSSLFDITDDGKVHLKSGVTAGVYEVVIVVTDIADDQLFSKTDTIIVTVVASQADLKPTILTESFNYTENDTYLMIVESASSLPETLVYSLGTVLDTGKFNISTTGELAFKVAPDYENPIDIGLDNSYEVEVIVTDGNGNTDTKTITITVFNIDDGIPGLGYTNFQYSFYGGSYWYDESRTFNSLRDDYIYALTMIASPQASGDQVTYSLVNNSDTSVFVLTGDVLYMYIPETGFFTDYKNGYTGSVDVVANDEHGNSAVYSITVFAD